ncbi:hypothetical protein ONZ45_g3868 [Pleurotus djamor]|nr:hypothetical protein ONZ45_g3868 [Pleurotus djamor]
MLFAILGGIVCFLSYFYLRHLKAASRIPLPPGPPGEFLLGHLRRIPESRPEFLYTEWSKTYGDIVYFTMIGRPMIILNSVKVAIDLLEQRSALYSDRPNLTVYELLGWEATAAFLRYGPRFRKHRKLLHQQLAPHVCPKFQHMQAQNAHLLVAGLMESNDGKYDHLLSRFSTAIAMRIAYGHQIVSDNDEYIKLSNAHISSMSESGNPGANPVDFFPFATSLPGFPERIVLMSRGSGDHRLLSYKTSRSTELGLNIPTQEHLEDMRGTAGVIYAAGAGTTWSELAMFFVIVLLHPHIQERGQEEIDRVVGRDRLPTFEDFDKLPYVGGLVEELFRWHPIAPLGIPHRTTADDVYQGMFIPKGSYVFANAYAMSLDENMYKDPKTFNPLRYLPKSIGGNEEPPFTAAFGFGRRICPGRHLATSSIWIAVATILATLSITPTTARTPIDVTYGAGLTRHPEELPCEISPRSHESKKLVRDALEHVNAL